MKNKILTLFVAAVLTITACGCSNKKSTGNMESITDIVSSDNNLNIYCYNADTYNPLFAKNSVNMNFSRICFEPLVKVTDNQLTETVLAQGYFISTDGLEWTVSLKDDVFWHDSDKLSAADVAATFAAVINDAENSVYAYNVSNIDSVEAVDNLTVKFLLKAPQTSFANMLEVPIVKEEYCTAVENFKMIGTGAYKYLGTENKKLFFAANDKWWGGEKPKIANITASVLPDKETSADSFNAGVIDVIPASIKDWSKYPSAYDNSAEYSTGDFFYLKFNMQNEYLANAEMRKGIVCAIDKQAICDKSLLSHGVVTDTIFNPKWEFYNKDAKKYSFNFESAKNAVNKVLGDTRISLSLIANEGSEIKSNTAAQIKEILAPIGIDVDVRIYGWDDYLNVYNSGGYDIALCETNISPDLIPMNIISESEKAMQVLDKLQNCSVDEQRFTYFAEIQNAINTEAVIIPLFFDMGMLLCSERVKDGVSPTRTNIYNNIHLWSLNT